MISLAKVSVSAFPETLLLHECFDFEKVLNVFEEWIRNGYVFSSNEMRFSYMAFLAPKQIGKEFVPVPIWAGNGITRHSLSVRIRPEENLGSLAFTAYMNPSIRILNVRPERRYVPRHMTWRRRKETHTKTARQFKLPGCVL